MVVPARREVAFTKAEARMNPPDNRGSRLSTRAIQAAPVARATRALPVMHLVRVTKTRVAKGVRWALLRAVPGTLAIEVIVLVAIMTDTPRIIAEAWAAAALLVARYP